MRSVPRVRSWNRVSQDQQESESSFISPSRHKMAPYLTIYFNRTETITVDPGTVTSSVTVTLTSTFTSTTTTTFTSSFSTSGNASFLLVPFSSTTNPEVFTTDGDSGYLAFQYAWDLNTGTDYTAVSGFSSTTVQGFNCWKFFAVQEKFSDISYSYLSALNKFNFNNSDFTVEVDLNLAPVEPSNTNDYRLFSGENYWRVYRDYSTNHLIAWVLDAAGENVLYLSTSYSMTSSQWYSIAFCRNGNTFKLLVDGVQYGSLSYSGTLYPFENGLFLGDPGAAFQYVKNLRVYFRQSLY